MANHKPKLELIWICCSAFLGNARQFENLTVKKIPKAVLGKCEWGHDDYSLQIANLPQAAPSSDSLAQPQPQAKILRGSRKVKEQPLLFDEDQAQLFRESAR